MSVYIGADVSKGYADFCVLTADGEVRQQLRLDDTRRGHDRLEEMVRLYEEQQDETLLIGMEATGGLELNWLHTLKTLEQDANLTVYQLNPYVLRKFVEQRLHVNKTDVSSARSIADYLRRGLAEDHTPYADDGPSRGLRTLARKTKRMIDQSVQLKNELQALLQRAHPELVQHLRGHMSQWVLKLIREYPTPTKLLEAAPQEVAEIPYVTEAKAERLIEAARTSVASQQDEDTGLALSLMAEDLLRLESRIGRLKERLWDRIKDRRAPHLLKSIGGIGRWSATVLYCEIGDIARFSSPKQLVAYAGLDPRREQSGDQQIDKSISKQGNRRIRSILYGCVTAAIRGECNPAVRALYDRLRAKGKHQKTAEVACMRKLLAIVYGCWANGRWFDPTFEERLKAHQRNSAQKSGFEKHVPAEDGRDDAGRRHLNSGTDIEAPVSRQEAAKRKKKATLPQKSISSSARGQSAFPTEKIPKENPSVNA